MQVYKKGNRHDKRKSAVNRRATMQGISKRTSGHKKARRFHTFFFLRLPSISSPSSHPCPPSPNFSLPTLDLLLKPPANPAKNNKKEQQEKQRKQLVHPVSFLFVGLLPGKLCWQIGVYLNVLQFDLHGDALLLLLHHFSQPFLVFLLGFVKLLFVGQLICHEIKLLGLC